MKDMEWLLINWGIFLLLLFIAVFAGGFTRVKENEIKNEQSVAVWEPPVGIVNSDIAETSTEEVETEAEPEPESEQDLWFLPQAEYCLITDTEKEELDNRAMTDAEQVKEVYKDIEITDESPYGSNIKEYTRRSGSGYIAGKDKTVLESRLEQKEQKTSFIRSAWHDHTDIDGMQRRNAGGVRHRDHAGRQGSVFFW